MFVQCNFCSRSNPADAQFCGGCLVQLSLAPCPHCGGVNEASARVCHACKGELVQAVVECASGGNEQGETRPAPGGIDTWPRSATQSTASGGFLGSTRETYVSTEHAAARFVERLEGSIRQHEAVPAKTVMVPLPAPELFSRTPEPFTRRHIAAIVGAGLVLAIVIVVGEFSRSPVQLTSPLPGALPGEGITSTEWDAPAQRTATIQGDSLPGLLSIPSARELAAIERESTFAFPLTELTVPAAAQDYDATVTKPVEPASIRATVQSSIAVGAGAKVTDIAAACSAGGVALGLCPSGPIQAQPAMQIGSSTDHARGPARDYAGRCDKAVAALGLCAE
jgi:hypothetical protein